MAKGEKDRLLEHSYDGIQEYDNPMPAWWVTTFWATIVFAALYLLNIPGIGTGKGRVADYETDMAAFRLAHPKAVANIPPEKLLAVVADKHELSEGAKVFAKNCVACHAADGGGTIGPNLTDDYWIHGGKIEDIYTTIFNGVAAKGMPTWSLVLKPDELQEVTAYIWSLHGTTPAKPKPPQGELAPR